MVAQIYLQIKIMKPTIQDYKTFFKDAINDEREAIKAYTDILDSLPKDKRFDELKSLIQNILHDEQKHLFILKSLV